MAKIKIITKIKRDQILVNWNQVFLFEKCEKVCFDILLKILYNN